MESEVKPELKIVTTKRRFVFGANELDTEAKHIFRYHVFVPDDVEIEELLDPAAWSHIAHKLRPMSRITVTSESNKFTGELVVISCDRLWAKTEIVHYKEFNVTAKVDPAGEFETKWLGNRWKFGIVRKSDNETLIKELPDQAAANIALANFTSEFKRSV